MSIIKILIVVFICAILYKFLSNLTALLRIKHYKLRYIDCFKSNSCDFAKYKYATLKLFERAEIKDSYILPLCPFTPAGVITSTISVFSNVLVPDKNVYTKVVTMFDTAIGVYENRLKDTINPLYWLDLIIFAPKHLLLYFNTDMNQTSAKMLHAVLTFLWWLLTLTLSIFKEDILAFLISFLQQMQKLS